MKIQSIRRPWEPKKKYVRLDSDPFYTSPEWRRTRADYLRAHPWCECDDCKRDGIRREATMVDHRVQIINNGPKHDWNNLCAMAEHPCHQRKCQREATAARLEKRTKSQGEG